MKDIYGTRSGTTAMQSAKEAMQRLQDAINAQNEKKKLLDELKESQTEWIWVEGYKATKADMTCNGYQYEFGKVHYMPTDAKIVECESGFHLCRDLKDVFKYYDVGGGNRYFKVKALVRKNDYERYGTVKNDSVYSLLGNYKYDKLVSSAIEFISEVHPDEVLNARGVNTYDWTEEDIKIAIAKNVQSAKDNVKLRELTSLGYALPFAHFLIAENLSDRAVAIGSQSDLSMDMKVMFIMRGK